MYRIPVSDTRESIGRWNMKLANDREFHCLLVQQVRMSPNQPLDTGPETDKQPPVTRLPNIHAKGGSAEVVTPTVYPTLASRIEVIDAFDANRRTDQCFGVPLDYPSFLSLAH